jgi:hypothetical protein
MGIQQELDELHADMDKYPPLCHMSTCLSSPCYTLQFSVNLSVVIIVMTIGPPVAYGIWHIHYRH